MLALLENLAADVDHGPLGAAIGEATRITGLQGLFALLRSLMARPFFKRAWKRIIPQVAECSTNVLFSSLALLLWL